MLSSLVQVDYPEAILWFEVVGHNYLGLKPYLKCTVFTVTYDSLFVMLSDANMLTFDGCEFILESQLH